MYDLIISVRRTEQEYREGVPEYYVGASGIVDLQRRLSSHADKTSRHMIEVSTVGLDGERILVRFLGTYPEFEEILSAYVNKGERDWSTVKNCLICESPVVVSDVGVFFKGEEHSFSCIEDALIFVESDAVKTGLFSKVSVVVKYGLAQNPKIFRKSYEVDGKKTDVIAKLNRFRCCIYLG